jgi:hypothetical protein
MSRIDTEQLTEVTRRLGEAALDPAQWPRLMQQICQALAATGALMLQSDIRTPDIPVTSGIVELVEAYFKEGWHNRDSRAVRGVPANPARRGHYRPGPFCAR